MCPGKHNVLAFLHSVGPKAPDPDDEIRKVLCGLAPKNAA
jgi:hypothetical protein